jgi:hypothetical protein
VEPSARLAEDAATIGELAAIGLVALTPDGDKWKIDPAVVRDPTHQHLTAEIDRVVEFAALDHVDQEEVAELLAASNLVAGFSRIGDYLCDPSGDVYVYEEIDRLAKADLVPYRLDKCPSLERVQLRDWKPTVIRDDQVSVDVVHGRTRQRLAPWGAAFRLPSRRVDEDEAAWRERLESVRVEAATLDAAWLERLRAEAAALTEEANRLYATLLVDAPPLDLDVSEPRLWFSRTPVRWTIRAPVRDGPMSLDELSEAQRRWALVSIAVVEADRPGTRMGPLSAIVLDEPDAALHATAERFTIDGLSRLATETGAVVFLSTHSREFLNHPAVRRWHVRRAANGSVLATQLPPLQLAMIHELGLQPADLLLLSRAFLIVEGEHDKAVLGEVIGNDLADLAVRLLPMRGGKRLATVVDAALLAEFSDVPVVVVLDNIAAEEVRRYWSELLAARDAGVRAVDAANDRFRKGGYSRSREFLTEFDRSAVLSNQVHRFHPFGLSKRDIIEYLPVERIVPAAGSWADLRREHEQDSPHEEFKQWLRQRHKAKINVEELRRSARNLDEVPADFAHLLGLCRRVIGNHRANTQ